MFRLQALSEPLQNVQQISLYFIWKLSFKSNGTEEIHTNLAEEDQRIGVTGWSGEPGKA